MTNQGLCIFSLQAYENFGWKNGVRLWCNPVEKGPGFSDSGYAMARILWIHYLSKVRKPMLLQAVAMHIQCTDLLCSAGSWPCCWNWCCCHCILATHCCLQAYEFVDTLIMILKKNNRQITFLHVYHHVSFGAKADACCLQPSLWAPRYLSALLPTC